MPTSENAMANIFVTATLGARLASPTVVSDTTLGLSDILGKTSVSVNVLANTFFADGPVSALKLSVVPGYGNTAQVTANKRIRITVGAK